jgi:hypothetical protein
MSKYFPSFAYSNLTIKVVLMCRYRRSHVQCAEKMTVGHVGADESRKGGVSVLGVILRVCKV